MAPYDPNAKVNWADFYSSLGIGPSPTTYVPPTMGNAPAVMGKDQSRLASSVPASQVYAPYIPGYTPQPQPQPMPQPAVMPSSAPPTMLAYSAPARSTPAASAATQLASGAKTRALGTAAPQRSGGLLEALLGLGGTSQGQQGGGLLGMILGLNKPTGGTMASRVAGRSSGSQPSPNAGKPGYRADGTPLGWNAEDRRAAQQAAHDQKMYGNITRSLI